MNSPLVLSLDIGSTSTRALAFDARGHKIGPTAQRTYRNRTTPDGGVEFDGGELFDLTTSCIDEILPALDGPIIAISTSCFWHSLMGVDDGGKARTAVFSWADNRAAPFVQTLRERGDESAIHARTGCVFHPSYWPAKLLWLHATRPELFDCQTRWISFGEYLLWRLTGVLRVSLSMASATGIFDQNRCDWDSEMLGQLPIESADLSPLCDASFPLEPLLASWRERWPQLKNARCFAAIGDGACSNLGSGGVDANAIVLNCGTSGALRIVLADWTAAPPRGLWRYHIDARRSVLGGALSNAGNVLDWARRQWNLPADWKAQIARERPHNLTVLPFLAGERSPIWNADARLTIQGATLDTDAIDLLRGTLEGATLRFKIVADALRTAMNHARLLAADEIIYSGGVLDAVPAWRQMMADCLNAPLVQSGESEASARGAALLALETCQLIGDAADLPAARGAIIAPDSSRHAYYEAALQRHLALYERLISIDD